MGVWFWGFGLGVGWGQSNNVSNESYSTGELFIGERAYQSIA
jgi:hypothetical protein